MSTNIKQLIDELCPDGVEWKTLGEITEIATGTQLNKTNMLKEGLYPVYNGGINPSGYYNEYNVNENTIAISQGGASAGYVNFVTTKFWAGAHCYVVKPINPNVNNRFLYFFLKNGQEEIQKAKDGAGIPGLNKKYLQNFPIPLPPLPVQEEIVRILDKFTADVNELIQLLERELELRNKQYEYYRNKLLTPTEENGSWLLNGHPVEWKTLGEVCEIEDNKRKPVAASKRISGEIPYYGANNIQDYVDGFTHNGEYVLIAEDGSKDLKNYSIQYVSGKFWANNHIHVVKGKEFLLNKFLFYYLKTFNFIPFLNGGERAKLTKENMLKIPIPIPPLSEQERIVTILDKFDALVNDISQGLPAEIEARKKQYEYYRNKLLTFKEKDS
jgi:type I restriction enzyme S subunit